MPSGGQWGHSAVRLVLSEQQKLLQAVSPLTAIIWQMEVSIHRRE